MEERNESTKANSLLSAAMIVIVWGTILTFIFISIHINSTYFYIMSVFVIGTCQRYLEELSHQAIHRNLFSSPKLNDKLEFLYAIPLFYTITGVRKEHYKHHLRLREEQETKNYSYDHLGISNQLMDHKWYRLFVLYLQPFIGIQAVLEMIHIVKYSKKYFFSSYIHHVFLLAILLYYHMVSIYMYFWLIPYFTVFCLFYYYSELFTHFGCREKYLNRDTVNWFVNYFVAPLGFCKHHSLHHVFPNTPWNRYGSVDKVYEKNQQTLLQTLKDMFTLGS